MLFNCNKQITLALTNHHLKLFNLRASIIILFNLMGMQAFILKLVKCKRFSILSQKYYGVLIIFCLNGTLDFGSK